MIRRECGCVNLTSTSIVTKWQWAVAQLAQYCVDVRIKTPFGKALETFVQFESMFTFLLIYYIFADEMRRLAKSITPNSLSSINDRSHDENSGNNDHQVSTIDEWMRVRMLLNFIEALDKMMYNAYEGAAFSPAHVSKVCLCDILFQYSLGITTIFSFKSKLVSTMAIAYSSINDHCRITQSTL